MRILFSGLLLAFALQLNGQILNGWASSQLNNSDALEGALVGASVIDLGTGKTLFDKNSKIRMIPASTLKLLTAKTALEVFGNGFRFETDLRHTGQISQNGILQGNLYWIGSGDPLLGDGAYSNAYSADSLFLNIYEALKNKGIKKVDGQLIIIDAKYGTELVPRHWLWEDVSNYYGAGARAFNFMANAYEIIFSRTQKTGDLVRIIKVDPVQPGAGIRTEVRVGEKGSGDQAFVFGGPYSDNLVVRGTIPPGKSPFSISAATNDPASMAADLLVKYLEDNGILISDGYEVEKNLEKISKNEESILIYRHFSPQMDDIVGFLLNKSHNLVSEALLKRMMVDQGGEPETHLAADYLLHFWVKQISGASNWRLFDGSGLSPMNRMTPFEMAYFLKTQYHKDDFYNWLELIPKGNEIYGAGEYIDNLGCLVNLHIKTGSISNVQNYAGYLKTKSGKTLSITIFFSDYNCPRRSIRKIFFDFINQLYLYE